jgi:hypothetical protein
VRTAAAFFLSLLCLFLLAQAGRDATEGDTAVDLERALRRGELSLKDKPFGPYAAGPDGRFWLAQDYLAPLLATPAVALGDSLAAPKGLPADAWARFLESAMGALVGAGIGLLLHVGARRLGVPARQALLVAAVGVLASPVLPYARTHYDGELSALLLLGGVLAARKRERTGALLCGALLGLACLARYSTAVAALPVVLVLLAGVGNRERLYRLLLAALAAAPSLALLLFLNALRTGSALRPPSALPEFAHNNAFLTPFFVGFGGNLFSPGKGLLFHGALAFLGIAGFFAGRRKLLGAVALLSLLALALIHAKVRNWSGHWAFGPRYLLPAVPLCLLGLGPLVSRGWGKVALGIVGGLSLLVQLSAVLVNWQMRIGAAGVGEQDQAWLLGGNQILDNLGALLDLARGGCPPISSVEAARCVPDLFWLTWPRAGAGGGPLVAAGVLAAAAVLLGALSYRWAKPR